MTVEVLAGLRDAGTPTMRRPPDWLSHLVIGYVVDESPTGAVGRIRCLPNGVVVMAIDIGGPTLRLLGDVALPASPVIGIHDSVHSLTMLGHRQTVAVLLTPWGAHSLLGVGMHELANQYVGLAELVGPEGREIAERLAAEPNWAARFAVLDDTLTRWFADGPEPSAAVVRAWRLLEKSAGQVPIRALAQEVGWSTRRLAMRFRDQVGLSPKKGRADLAVPPGGGGTDPRRPVPFGDRARVRLLGSGTSQPGLPHPVWPQPDRVLVRRA